MPAGVTDRYGTHAFWWDGTNDNGQPVSNGGYWFKWEVEDPGQHVNVYSIGVQVSRPDQADALGIYNSAGERVARLALPPGADAGSFSLSTVSGPGFTATVPVGTSGTATVTWNGLSDEGRLVANGTYWVRAETKGLSRSESFSLLRGPIGNGSLTAGPDPLLRGQDAWDLRFEARPGATARAELYDLAGESVRVAEGPADGRLSLGAGGLSGGLYILVFQVDGPQGYLQRCKLALIR
jgi:hypothetical protein